MLLVFPILLKNFNNLRFPHHYLPSFLLGAIFLIGCDFLKYVFHYYMHKPSLWSVHKSHHSPKVLYWLSGNRASVPMLFLHFAPLGFLTWYMNVELEWVLVNNIINIFWNNLMHTNLLIPFRVQRQIEYLFVTPRYHFIHHADMPVLYNKNFGSVLSIWDRLYGTYYNPDLVDYKNIKFGNGENESTNVRNIVLGI